MLLLFLLIPWSVSADGSIVRRYESEKNGTVREFPSNFTFGSSTASYQIEGGWNSDGKSESIWDHIVLTNPCYVTNCDNGNIAADSYNNYQRDVEMLRELGVDFYRFSLSWTRILPSSYPDQINEPGVAYYNNLINELLTYNITPMVTIYHWDLPQKLQELGGWANPLSVEWFGDFARTVFSLFGDRVKSWITINEPKQICYNGYGDGITAPAIQQSGIGNYLCSKHVLVAHATAYRIYDTEFRATQGGIVGISLSGTWVEPDTEADEEIAEILYQFDFGQYAHPIFSQEGNWPQVMIDRIAAKSAEQGFPRSRLPAFTDEEITLVRGSADFFGLNHYTSTFAYRNDSVIGMYDVPSYRDDIGAGEYRPITWPVAVTSWLSFAPWGFTKLLQRIRDLYGNPVIYVTENGFSTSGGLDDINRIFFYRSYWNALADAIEDGVNVRGYSAWTLMDNFEWTQGYTERFGLYQVDFTSAERTRTPRKSALVYAEFVRSHALDWTYEPPFTASGGPVTVHRLHFAFVFVVFAFSYLSSLNIRNM